MEQMNSFGKTGLRLNESVLKMAGMLEFFEESTNEMKVALCKATAEYGMAVDLDNIIRGTFIRPVFVLRECGWSDEQILSLSQYELALAAGSKYGYCEFKDLLQKLKITSDTDERLALRMLQRKADVFECELADKFPQYKVYLEAMHSTLASDVSLAGELLQIAYVENPTKWYLGMLRNIDVTILRRLKKYPGVFTITLGLLPLLERGDCSISSILSQAQYSSMFWVHISTNDVRCSIPIYRWDLMWQIWADIDRVKLRVACSDKDLYLYDDAGAKSFSRYDYGIVTLNEEDPVLTFVNRTLRGLKLNPDIFDEQSKFSEVFFALKEMIDGRQDWYLFLRYPEIFSAFGGINHKVTVADVIRYSIPNDKRRDAYDLCTGLVQIGDSISTIYVAFASGAIQKCLDRGEIVNVGCSKEKVLSFNDYAVDFINWVQQTEG